MIAIQMFALRAAFTLAALSAPLPWQSSRALHEVNVPPDPDASHPTAIVGAKLIDGQGGSPISDSVVIVSGAKIMAAGPRIKTRIPSDAEKIDARGQTLIPGLMDSHFHIERDYQLPRLFLSHGVTSVRDPGQWIKIYDPVVKSDLPQPRFFLCGPHLDNPPVAYPADSFVVMNEEETRAAVNRFVDEGASAIKVYFRLPEKFVQAACEAAHQRGVPVTAHLELLDARKAIEAGLDGVEHVTSFGAALAEPKDSEAFRAEVAADNEARRNGRYALWSKLDLANARRTKPLIDLILKRHVFLSPTLAVFEVRRGDKDATEEKVRGFENMLQFVRLCHRAGATIVVGSHSEVPHAVHGWAYVREMELLVECGLTPLEVIKSATLNQARFFRTDSRLGSIQAGKLADLILVDGDLTQNIKAIHNVRRVMLNGRWVIPSQ